MSFRESSADRPPVSSLSVFYSMVIRDADLLITSHNAPLRAAPHALVAYLTASRPNPSPPLRFSALRGFRHRQFSRAELLFLVEILLFSCHICGFYCCSSSPGDLCLGMNVRVGGRK